MNHEMTQSAPSAPSPQGINWKDIGLFLGLTFGLTYLLNLVMYLIMGDSNQVGVTMLLQLQMLIPAGVAIALQLFVFKGDRLYHTKKRPRWFFYYYLAYSVTFTLAVISVFLIDNTIYASLVSLFTIVLGIGGLVLVVLLRLIGGKQEFQGARLGGGKVWHYIVFGLALVLFYFLMTGLDALFGLGQPVDVVQLIQDAAGGQTTGLEQVPEGAWLLILALQNILINPLLGLLIAFGEEYGWRGYLQGELIKIGKVRGILLVGIIWGLWHAPIIAMGHNYPGHPVLGPVLMTLYTIGLGFFLGYAVLKTGSVWLAAFLHALNNGVASFLLAAVYRPDDMIYSFGIGLYSLVFWVIIVAGLLLFDRKAWATPATPELVEEAESL